MPNGGSDCCGTCWFNSANKGEAGYHDVAESATHSCVIRELQIMVDPFWTYCANHPHRSPDRDPIPIGPIFVDKGEGRDVWRPSQDSPVIRDHLLALLADINEKPDAEYPIGIYRDEIVVWQLGEFAEPRAVPHLKRIAAFRPRSKRRRPFPRTRELLVEVAEEALGKISGSRVE